MKLTIAISLVAHMLVIALLGVRVSTGSAIVGVAVLDRSAPPRAQPAPSSKPTLHALERASRPRVRRAARSLPVPVPQAPPAPLPAPEPSVDESEPVETSSEPPPAALPPAAVASAPPALSRQPGWDPSSCDRELVAPASMRLQDETVVRLEVELDAKGQVLEARVVERPNQPLEDIALQAVRRKCRFTAGIDAQGNPVPTIFELRLHIRPPDFQTPVIGHFLLQ